MLFPYPPHGRFTDALLKSHHASAPMSGITGLGLKRRLNYPTNFLLGNLRNPSGARRVCFQTLKPKRKKTFSPQLNCRSGNLKLSCNLFILRPAGCQKDNAGTFHKSCRNTSSSRQPIQLDSFRIGQHDQFCFSRNEMIFEIKHHKSRDL